MKKVIKIEIISIVVLLILSSISVSTTTTAESDFDPQYETQANHNITITNPIPVNGSSGLWPFTEYGSPYSTYNLYFDLNHSSGKAMNWTAWTNASGWTWLDWEDDVYNGTEYAVMDGTDGMTEYNTTYYWDVNVTNYTDGDGVAAWQNISFSFKTGNQSHITLDNLTEMVNRHITFFATEQSTDVWSNNSGDNNETMVINITINDTLPDGYVNAINVYLSNFYCYGDWKTYWINASNFTMYVAGVESGPYFELGQDLGNGNSTFLDSEYYYDAPNLNLTINSDTWGGNPNDPWNTYGDGVNITSSCQIYVRFKANVPYFTQREIADINNQTYFYSTHRVWANMSENSKVLMYRLFNGMFYIEQEYRYKPGYDNCTWGPPDFDQKQNEANWKGLPGTGVGWTYCGPTALANCLWWLDCKYNNVTKNYKIPDFTGQGSKHPDNVIPLIDWLGVFVNTSTPIVPGLPTGTSAENMTVGILDLLNVTNVSHLFDVTVEGYTAGDLWGSTIVNYTNITNQIDNCSDVILLLGFYCEYGPAMWGRIGGHYVQVDGYNSQNPGLLIADPYKDNAEDGGDGWVSDLPDLHDHDLYGNGSHNWTQNVSYDYYDVGNVPGAMAPSWFYTLENYTDGMGNLSANWSNANEYDDTYPCEACFDCIQLLTLIEVAWYIHEADTCNLSVNKTVWDGANWVEWYNTSVGTTITSNITIYNNGSTVRSLVVGDTYYDAWNYTAGTSTIYFSDGTASYAREPNASIPCSDESCQEARHGFLYWYLNYSDVGMPLMPGQSIWIHSNWTVFNTHYSPNILNLDVCLVNDSCMDWMYVNCSYADTAYLNPKFNKSIGCPDCPSSNEASEWNLSEHIHSNCTEGECYDYGWEEYETDFDKWYSYNTLSDDWGWIYRYYDQNGDGADQYGLSYTIANNSCANRSMYVVKMRYTYDWLGAGDFEIPTIGTIYSFKDNNNYDMVLYGFNTTYLLSKIAGTLVNTMDGSPVQYPHEAINYYTFEWWCNDSSHTGSIAPDQTGIWTKTLYNDFTDSIRTKAWGVEDGSYASDICNETSGWIATETQQNNSFVVAHLPAANYTDDFINIYRNHPSGIDQSAVGQVFTTPTGKRYFLDRVGFYLRSWMGLNGNLTANLYETAVCDGAKGPTGAALATSDLVDCLSLGGGPASKGLYTSFPFDTPQYLMQAGHEYAISIELQDSTNADGVIYVDVADAPSDTYNGNEFDYFAGDWECWTAWDMIFHLIGRNDTITDQAEAFGLVIWNPERQNSTGELTFDADFDWIDMWRLNYSRDEEANATEITAHPTYGPDGIPLMEFPQFTAQNWNTKYIDWYYDVYVAWFDGNISNHTYADSTYCYWRNISSLYNLESRMFYPELDCGSSYKMNDQNDSLYYYSAVVTNITTLNYKNGLIFEIQDAADGTADTLDAAIVGIDVDNNLQWDDNDMMFIWYNNTGGINYTIYRGTNLWDNGTASVTNIDAFFDVDMADCLFNWKSQYLFNVDYSLPALHRYSEHRVYYARIPLYYLIKSNGEMLNTNDTFGLYVQTIDANWAQGWTAPDGAPIWNNWNETSDSWYTLGEVSASDIYNNFYSYLNLSTNYDIEQFRFGNNWNGTVPITNHQYWAHGRILNITGYMTENTINVSCNCSDPEKSGICVRENVFNGSIDHAWSELEPTKWNVTNTSALATCPDWEWTYRYNDSDGAGGDINHLSYSIANESCTNYSQSILRMRWYDDDSDGWEPYLGVIYSYEDKTNFHMVLYGFNNTFLLTVDNGVLKNTEDGTAVINDGDCIDYWDYYWNCNETNNQNIDCYCDGEWEGLWAKTIFNQYSGHIQAKAWVADFEVFIETFGLAHEPAGWIVDRTDNTLVSDGNKCFGLVTWNPYGNSFVADFDFVKEWRLNTSKDEKATAGQESDHPMYGTSGIPLMEFPTFNMTTFNVTKNEWISHRNQWLYGNMTNQTFFDRIDFYTYQMTNLMSMEARQVNFTISCGNESQQDDQNDSIYYYTSVLTDLTATEGKTYNNALRIHIEDATDGSKDVQVGRNNMMSDGAIVAIDVDNDMEWDENDVAIGWYAGIQDTSNFTIWRGTSLLASGLSTSDYSYFVYNKTSPYNISDLTYGFPALHRYSSHRTYDATIPLYYLVKENGRMLNVNDTFGLHIMTINYRSPTALTPVWQNWNESSNTNFICSDDNSSGIFSLFMNLTSDNQIMDFFNWTAFNGTGSANMQKWGHGRILNTSGWLQENWVISMSKVANVTNVSDITVDNLVNYTIVVCNNGSSTLTNVSINDTLAPGVVYVGSTLNADNVTGSDRNWTFNITWQLNTTSCATFNITVNLTVGCAPNGSWVINFAKASANEPTIDYDTALVFYGENNAPVINWTYPVNNSLNVNLLLANISCYIYDADGDAMNVYIYTNKSGWGDSIDTWTPIWNEIGGGAGEFQYTDDSSVILFNDFIQYGAQAIRIGANGGNTSFNITSIKVRLNRVADPGMIFINLTTMLNLTSPNITNVISYSVPVNSNTISTAADGLWYTFYMSNVTLTPGISYAILMQCSNNSGANNINWFTDDTGGYTGGYTYIQSMAVWLNDTSEDATFVLQGSWYNGVVKCNQTLNNNNLLNTRWRWGNTMYYFWINVTDGSVWTNESFNYTTESSRYDVTTSGDVVITDVVRCWDYRAGAAPYRGIYDIDASGDVTIGDVVSIWDHRS